MIGNKLEQSIIAVFQNNLSNTYSINEISRILKKSYPNINKKSNYFLKEGILKKINIGKSYQCFLNLDSEKTKIFMAVNELNIKEEFLKDNKEFGKVFDELSQIYKRFSVDTIIYFKKNLIFILKDLSDKVSISELTVMSRAYNHQFMTVQEFQALFLNDMELQKNHVVLFSVENYLQMLSEINDKLFMKGFIKNIKND